MQPFPHPSDATCTYKIWSRLANWLQRYSSLKVWTTMDDGPLVYYKPNLWAFGSGELKTNEPPHDKTNKTALSPAKTRCTIILLVLSLGGSNWDFLHYCCNHPKLWTINVYYLIMCSKIKIANSVDPDQIAPSKAVWSGSELFASFA